MKRSRIPSLVPQLARNSLVDSLGRGQPFAPPPSVGGEPRSHSLRGESLTIVRPRPSCAAGRLHDAAEFAAKGAADAALTYAGSSHISPECERAPQARA